MADQDAMGAVLNGLTVQMGNMNMALSVQSVAQLVTPFEGEPKKFKEWVKGIERYSALTQIPADRVKFVAFQTAKGAVGDYIQRHLTEFPLTTWAELRRQLQIRFADVVDMQHALDILSSMKQGREENVEIFGERLLGIARDAFDGHIMGANAAIDRQLVGFFTKGLHQNYLRMKVMRDNPATLNDALAVARREENLRKRFNLQSVGNSYGADGEQPIEVDHLRGNRCFKCNKPGHKARDSRGGRRPVARQHVNAYQEPRKANYFTTLDLKSGYWQIAMDEKDKEKVSFACHKGLFEFNVMPFGLSNAPAVFQELMCRVLQGFESFAIAYLDDILIFSQTKEDHLQHIQQTFDRLKSHCLKLKLKKCYFMQEETKYLGFIINRDGVKPDTDKVKAIQSMPAPRS
ncbi:uncharacterized protein LOC117315870 [Pecten maximus]|uniref:uncharacterized protein LOC117315870 n=1 Tax=Pecten maximus TaxID=6579 RepID=UPI00145891AD|nr:uncharacterized protein LOC117315870 [Pecten maximus]